MIATVRGADPEFADVPLVEFQDIAGAPRDGTVIEVRHGPWRLVKDAAQEARARLTDVGPRFDAIEARLTSIERRLAAMEIRS